MRVFLADHHILFREGLAGLLSNDADIEVVGGSGDSRDVLDKVVALKPDILLIDNVLADGKGLEVMRAVYTHCPDVKAVVLSTQMNDELLLAAFENGAKGYLLKDIPIDHLIEALKAVMREEVAITRAMTRQLLDEIARRNMQSSDMAGLEKLTDRESEVLVQICNGASNSEIAAVLQITENTVKAHVRKILEKLNLQNRREAKRLAVEKGFLMRYTMINPPRRS